MTEQDELECERICGEAGKRDMHRSAPEICPILLRRWQGFKDPEPVKQEQPK